MTSSHNFGALNIATIFPVLFDYTLTSEIETESLNNRESFYGAVVSA